MELRLSYLLSFISILVLQNHVAAENVTASVQNRADLCPNPTGNACLFVLCENNGYCIEDSTTVDCFRCQCTSAFTGKTCNIPAVITPGSCNPACINGGVCNGNICFCPTGYTGTFCETRNLCQPTNPCQNGGRCTSSLGTSYTCDCSNTGFTGNICNQPVVADLCQSRPCQNGGQCSMIDGAASCLCVNGYTGAFCQVAPIPCAATPCENGGQCQQIATNFYACVCPPEFTGTRCETSILANHPCVVRPTAVCLNGGTCTVNGADYLCRCPPGWQGDNCQTRDLSSTCAPSPCGAYGTCFEVVLPSGPMAICNCVAGWTGKLCDVRVDGGCPVGYCYSGGTCRLIGNTPYCDCPPQYTGVRCELSNGDFTTASTTTTTTGTGLCASNPCMNGGTCFSSLSIVACSCPPLWTGRFCATRLPDPTSTTTTTTMMTTTTSFPLSCSPMTCLNGGSCYIFSNLPSCICSYPWGGSRCEENLETGVTSVPPTATTTTTTWAPVTPDYSTCADAPCRNGGTCVPIGSSYFCFCGTNSAYTGKRCDTTAEMPRDECPLECAPGKCVFSGNAQKPYACLWNGIMRPRDGTTA